MTTTVNTINGHEGNNRLTGTSRNDVINGNGGNDKLSGGSGDGTLNGGAGKDELNGGSGNDVLDGGSGSDELEGGSGNDTLIYTLAENNVIGRMTYDEYEGGSGTDTLELRFTRAEWMNEANQAVLQSYLKWASKSGSSCRWDDDFTFRFGNARLEIEDIEKLVVKVDGATIKDLGINTVDAVDDAPEKSITEDVTDVQKIYFLSNDKVNYLVKDVKLELSTTKGNVLLVKDDLDNTETWYFKYTPNSNHYQYLNTGVNGTDSFKYTVIDAKGKEDTAEVKITITGVNDAAIIGDLSIKQLTEDEYVDPDGIITLTGEITIADADKDEASFVASYTRNKGEFLLQSNGSYTYKLKNADIQYLNTGDRSNDEFKIFAKDGTEKIIVITINGVDDVVNSAPVVKELGQGENKYAGSANVEELINLDHFTSDYTTAINLDYNNKAKYDFFHVRTGQFLISDVDVGDQLTVSNESTDLDEKIGSLETEILQLKDLEGNPIGGKYVVNWTYTVKDSELDPLNKGVDEKPTKDQKFILTIGDGTTTVNTEIVLHLFGRNEINFTDGETIGSNVIIGTIEADEKNNNVNNDVIYLGDGNDNATAVKGSDVIYGENGEDYFLFKENDSVIFGGNGNDDVTYFYEGSDNGLFFGGNGNDEITFMKTELTQNGYSWGEGDSDLFLTFIKTTSKSNSWVMDFKFSPTIEGGDKIKFVEELSENLFPIYHKWNSLKTQLVSHTADTNHPFLSEGAKYYELQVQSSIDLNDSNWYSLFNLVGTNGTDLTVSGLFANENLVYQ
jgi:VCBS repeat-containing protein